MRRLPSLNALRAFEATARHLSFSDAAEELHVTQSAVSRHIKGLEEYLGFPLFRRLHRAISLTDRGAALLPDLSVSFDRLADAVASVMEERRELRIKTPPTFAIRWMIPRLSEFQELHLDIDVRITTGENADFRREEFDAAIYCDRTPPAGLVSDHILTEVLTPVCSRNYLERHPLSSPADLARHVLIHPTPSREDWRDWLERTGYQQTIETTDGLAFSTLEMAVSAAMRGLGVAIADYGFVKPDLENGNLVMPLDIQLTSCFNYFFVCPEKSAKRPLVNQFRQWLVEASSSEREEMEAFRKHFGTSA